MREPHSKSLPIFWNFYRLICSRLLRSQNCLLFKVSWLLWCTFWNHLSIPVDLFWNSYIWFSGVSSRNDLKIFNPTVTPLSVLLVNSYWFDYLVLVSLSCCSSFIHILAVNFELFIILYLTVGQILFVGAFPSNNQIWIFSSFYSPLNPKTIWNWFSEPAFTVVINFGAYQYFVLDFSLNLFLVSLTYNHLLTTTELHITSPWFVYSCTVCMPPCPTTHT